MHLSIGEWIEEQAGG